MCNRFATKRKPPGTDRAYCGSGPEIGAWRRQYRAKLMSIFGNIGSFFRISAQGVVETISTLFQATHPEPTPTRDRTPVSYPNSAADSILSSKSGNLEFATPAVSAGDAAHIPAERVLSNEVCDLELATPDVSSQNAANDSPGRVLSSESRDFELAPSAISAGDVANERTARGNHAVKKSAPKKKARVAKQAAAKKPE